MTTTFNAPLPGVEQREAAWIKLQERLLRNRQVAVRPTITISRQYGCEGNALAARLKELLDAASGEVWTVFDKALVERVAADENLSKDLLTRLGDESRDQDVLRSHFGYLTHDDAYAKLAKHLLQIARVGCAIVVGRGGAVLCHDLTNCFHVRLVASPAFLAEALAQRRGIPLTDAEELVRVQSRRREQFISDNLHTDITSSRWYDAVFNNERQSVEGMAQACFSLVRCGWPDAAYFKRAVS